MNPHIEKAAKAICAAYGDDYDEQPADLPTLREWRKKGGAVDENGVGIVRAYDSGLPTQADWIECATAALSTTLEPSEAEIEAAMAVIRNPKKEWIAAGVDESWSLAMRDILIAAARVRVGE